MVPGTPVKCLTKITQMKVQSYFTIHILKYFTILEHGIVLKRVFPLSIPLRLEVLTNAPLIYLQMRTEVQ